MLDRSIVTAVASYRSRAGALGDLRALHDQTRRSCAVSVAAALVEKGDGGQLEIESQPCPAGEPPWNGALLGSVLTVLAPPAGLRFLVPLVAGGALLARVAALADYFWRNVAQHDLRQMSELLECGQAGLVIVTAGVDDLELERFMSQASVFVLARTVGDLDGDLALGEPSAHPGWQVGHQ